MFSVKCAKKSRTLSRTEAPSSCRRRRGSMFLRIFQFHTISWAVAETVACIPPHSTGWWALTMRHRTSRQASTITHGACWHAPLLCCWRAASHAPAFSVTLLWALISHRAAVPPYWRTTESHTKQSLQSACCFYTWWFQTSGSKDDGIKAPKGWRAMSSQH